MMSCKVCGGNPVLENGFCIDCYIYYLKYTGHEV